jgi:MFS transporter, OFA family, oxalate/formate antiporter
MNENTQNKRIRILICGIICCLILGFCYMYSIIQPYVMDYFSIESAEAALPYTIFLAVFVLGNYIGGVLQKKISIKKIMLIGYICMAVGILATGYLPNNCPKLMWITYGGFLGIGDGIVYNVIVAMMQKWFPDKKGFATGLALATLGISATILSPLCSGWLSTYGFSKTFIILAGIFVVIGIFGMITIEAPPAGYMADYIQKGGVFNTKQYEASEVIKTKTYYKLLLIQTFSIPAFVLISSIFVSFGEAKGLQTEILVAGVSIASLFQVAGRFIISSISDKISSKNSMILVFIITILSVIILTVSKGYVYIVCFWLLSFAYGGSAATIPSLTTDYFGVKNAGVIVSLVLIGMGVSSICTPLIAKAVGENTSFIIAAVAAVIGIVLVFSLPKKKK